MLNTITRHVAPVRHTPRFLAFVLCLLLVMVSATGCNPSQLDQTVTTIDQAIGTLQNAPATWQQVLPNTISDLNGGLKQALDDIAALDQELNDATKQLVFCVNDYFGKRAIEGLQAIVHQLSPKDHPAPTTSPTICSTTETPTELSPQVTAGLTQKVVFSGYDLGSFRPPARPDTSYTASIYYGNTEAIANFGSVSYTDPYSVEVAFQPSATAALDASKNPRLVLSWTGGNIGDEGGSSSLPIIFPPPPPTTDISVEVAYHVLPGLAQICEQLHNSHNVSYWDEPIPAGWKVDTTKGDGGHSGITLAKDDSNSTAKKFSSDWNYYANGDTDVRFSGTVCAAPFWGPGGIYDRTYIIHLVKR